MGLDDDPTTSKTLPETSITPEFRAQPYPSLSTVYCIITLGLDNISGCMSVNFIRGRLAIRISLHRISNLCIGDICMLVMVILKSPSVPHSTIN